MNTPCRHNATARHCWHAPELADAVMFHGHYNHVFMPHAHDAVTLIVVTGGRLTVEIDGIGHRAGKGQMVAIGAHQVHGARPVDSDGWKMRSMHLPSQLLAALLPHGADEDVHFTRPVRDGRAAGALLFDIHYCSQVGGPLQQRGERFASFLRCFADNLQEFGPRARPIRPHDEQLAQAHHLIGRDIVQNTSIESIAAAVGLSPFALIRRFKRLYGISPHAWRMQTRANQAAQLLRDRASLADAASSCGFADQSHMTRIFKRVFGVTPGQYGAMDQLAA